MNVLYFDVYVYNLQRYSKYGRNHKHFNMGMYYVHVQGVHFFFFFKISAKNYSSSYTENWQTFIFKQNNIW